VIYLDTGCLVKLYYPDPDSHLAVGVTGFGADVEEPVGLGGGGRVVLDDDDGVAFIDEVVEDVDEVEMYEVKLSSLWGSP
jgi:hypothetical protein